MDPIYVLRKRATGAVSSETGRYIGVTSELPEQRLRGHMDEATYSKTRNSHRLKWFRSLAESPLVEVIEWVLPMHRVEREKYWIALFRDYGHKLVNATEGGEGTLGFRHSPETIEKCRATNLGRKHTEETRARMSEASRGRKHTEETKAKMGDARRGRRHTEETKAKMSRAVRRHVEELKAKFGTVPGRPHTAESKAKMSAAHCGSRHTEETKAKMRNAHRARQAK